jgi:hypothetical protein
MNDDIDDPAHLADQGVSRLSQADFKRLIKELRSTISNWMVWSTCRSADSPHLQLVAIPWLIGMPFEIRPAHPPLDDCQTELLAGELNARSGWDIHIRVMTERTMAEKIAALPAVTVTYAGRA